MLDAKNPRAAYSESSPHHRELFRFCEANRSHVLARIPFLAAEIAGNCGFGVLFKLIAWRGGRDVFVPEGSRGLVSLLETRVGRESAEWFMKNYPNSNLVIPMTREIPAMFTAWQAKALRDDGATFPEIAERFGVHTRTVRRWVKKVPAELI